MFPQKQAPEPQAPPPPPAPVIHEPVATHQFELDEGDDVVGVLQVTRVQGEDTFSDIARRFNLGYEEMVRANPGIDPWVPGVGREIVLPTQYVLPDAPREGLVINLAQLRVFYFPKVKEGEPRTVITHPIGIGKIGWSTPLGTTKITSKVKDPTWHPPASVRKEHREAGDPLPARVPPGPDNPLGNRMMRLGWPSYLVHGTNKPYGVGMRSSHGCMRFYPEDILQLYDDIPVGTKVTVVDQPFVFGWHRGALYVQSFPIQEDDEREHPKGAHALLNAAISDEMWQTVKAHDVSIDLQLVNDLTTKPRGIAVPVSRVEQAPVVEHRKDSKKASKGESPPPSEPVGLTLEQYIADARHVENKLPEGSTWNGKEELLVSAEEFEATRSGAIVPKQKPAKKAPAAKPTPPAKQVQPAKQAQTSKAATKPAPVQTGSASQGSR
ncbi:MAG TPA: L,D-transpeptidase family protein [Povalibacter sp.]|nr:L,D-transpeptidase family protein [Povalibacter sp.]